MSGYCESGVLAPQRKPAIAALLPVNTLLPQIAPDGSALQGYARLRLGDGTLIGASGDDAGGVPVQGQISAQARSTRYGPTTTVTMLQPGTIANYDDLRRIGIVFSGMFAVAILIGAIFVPRRQRHDPVAEIETALVADEFIPYYQPIMDVGTGKLLGAEALVRWRKADGTVVSPGNVHSARGIERLHP